MGKRVTRSQGKGGNRNQSVLRDAEQAAASLRLQALANRAWTCAAIRPSDCSQWPGAGFTWASVASRTCGAPTQAAP